MLENNNYIEFDTFLSNFKDIIDISINSLKKSNNNFIICSEKTLLIDYDYVETQVNLYNKSKTIKLLSDELSKILPISTITSTARLVNSLFKKNIHIYNIPLFSKYKFISNEDFNKIVRSVNYVVNSNCFTTKQVLDKINELFIIGGYSQITTSFIKEVLKKNQLEFITTKDFGNFTGVNLLTENDTMTLFSKIKIIFEKNILCLNKLSIKEYYNLSQEDFLLSYISYDEIECVLKEFISIPKHITDYGFNYKFNLFKNTDIRVIGIRTPTVNLFINKKDFEKTIKTLRSYVNFKYINDTLNLSSPIEKKSLESQNIKVYSNLPFFTSGLYLLKKDADNYCKDYKFKKILCETPTIFGKYSLRIKYYPNEKESLIPETLKLLNDYVLYKSNKRRVAGSFDGALYDLYNILCNNLKVELTLIKGDKLQKELDKLLILSSSKARIKEGFVGFIDYLRVTNNHFKYVNSFKLVQTSQKVKPYSEKSFINLAIALIDIIENKELLEKTYYNWNNSSALCYIFLHLCLAWRRNDLITKLPTPNLNLIDDIEKYPNFIEWLKDGNELSEKTSLLICKDIETKVKRFNITANKNQQNLLCIIPKFLSKHLAILLCINKTNKDATKNSNRKVTRYDRNFTKLGVENVSKIFSKEFNVDLINILGDSFNNIKATKSFLTLITEKSEEFGLAYGYYLSQKLRAHKNSKEILSDTTKIYLDKDISKAAIMAFAAGTMGSVKYNLLALVDDNFESMSLLNKADNIVSLAMTPYEIETYIKTLAIKSEEIKKILLSTLTTKERKLKFFYQVLYGMNCYGKHEDTKCIFKIIKNIDNKIEEISVYENVKCPFRTKTCIGCVHLIAKRYFMYFVEDKFNEVLNSLESSSSQIDKEIHIGRLQEIYLPTILDLYDVFGKENVKNLLNIQKYASLAKTFSNKGDA